MSKNLILGVAENLKFKDICLFLGSLKKTNFNGDVCLFISKMNAVDRNTLRQYGVKIIAFKERFPYIKDTSEMDISQISARHPELRFQKVHMRSFRFIMYYLYLAKWKNEYSKVLLTDVIDVVFQKDPFDFDNDNDMLHCFLENRDKTIGSCHSNSSWVRDFFGEKVLDEIKENNIICSGVVTGTSIAIMEFLEDTIYCMKVFQSTVKNAIGDDQGMHNYVVYKKELKNTNFFYNETGPVMHLHYVPKDRMRFDKNGLLVNDKGDIVNIVHQYNRHPFLIEKFQEEYSIPELPAGIHLKISACIYDFLCSLKRKLCRLMRLVLFDFTHPLRHHIRLCACYLRK